MFGRFGVVLPLALAGAALMIGSQPVLSQHGEHAATARMPLYETVLGPYTRAITTSSPEAQAYFVQGVQLLYAFTPSDAVRSFQEAQRLDPQCAMCFWGEAWGRGPYLNGGMRADDAPLAFQAVQEARRLAARSATPVERAMIEAMATRYTERHDPATRRQLDEGYARAISEVYREFPEDLDVGTLYAEALMLLQPRRGIWPLEDPAVQRIHTILEETLARDITHPGACHLYVHATETNRPDKAEACADYLVMSIPGASHINHMPSHTYNRVGRWGDAVRSNVLAVQSDQRAQWGEGFAIYPSHNLHMLFFAASMDGQGAIANQASRDYAKMVRDGSYYHAQTLMRFGRFDEILELRDPPQGTLARGLWDFARGYAHLRTGSADSASYYLRRVEQTSASVPADMMFRMHSARNLLDFADGILRAEVLREQGKLEEAIAAARRSVEIEDGLTYDEPEPFVFPARHWLGALLLEAGRPQEAEREYEADLRVHPHNGWSLFGLEQALRAQNRHAEADRVRTRFEDAWTRAETVIRGSRF
jgi:tetratricopeptide (TPR) repeat protein